MRWPWKHDDDSHRKNAEAKEMLARVRAQWPEVRAAAERLEEGVARNHLVEKAFAIRERGNR